MNQISPSAWSTLRFPLRNVDDSAFFEISCLDGLVPPTSLKVSEMSLASSFWRVRLLGRMCLRAKAD